MNDLVIAKNRNSIAVLTLNRPSRHNSLIPALLKELLVAVESIHPQDIIRSVVLQANGRSFSTGGDLRAFYEHLDEIETYADEIVGLLNEVMLAMVSLPMPIIAAIHGIVTGGSIGLVLASDIVMIAPQASITPFYSLVGFSPDGGWTALLPEIIGEKQAKQILEFNHTITPQQAVEWGLADRLVPSETVREEAFKVAKKFASLYSPYEQQYKKHHPLSVSDLAQRLEDERVKFVQKISTVETQQSMVAFLNSM